MKCADCSKISTGSAISLYLFLELIPITLFFLCVVLFRLNITAGPLLGYVLFCQIYYTAVGYEIFIYDYILSQVEYTAGPYPSIHLPHSKPVLL